MSNLSLPDQLIDDIANQSTKHAQGWTRLPIKILVDEKYLDDGNKKKNRDFHKQHDKYITQRAHQEHK